MACTYIPIVRTFCRLRAELVRGLGVDRRAVRPGAALIDLLPIERRREVWRRLRREGLDVPGLDLSPQDPAAGALLAAKTAVSLALALQSWYALLSFVPMLPLLGAAIRHRAVHLPLGITTVGELVVYITRCREHRDSGYRWTRNEIAMKVRLIVAESLGLTLDAVDGAASLEALGAR